MKTTLKQQINRVGENYFGVDAYTETPVNPTRPTIRERFSHYTDVMCGLEESFSMKDRYQQEQPQAIEEVPYTPPVKRDLPPYKEDDILLFVRMVQKK